MSAFALGPQNASAQWVPDGVAVTSGTADQDRPAIAPDGEGGAIVVWDDTRRIYPPQRNIYAQRLDAQGFPLWKTNGVRLCGAADDQVSPAIVPDGAGGAIVVWRDLRDGVVSQVFAQRVDASGNTLWAEDGVSVPGGGAAVARTLPVVVADGAGGAIVIWRQADAATGFDLFAQRLDAAGAPVWTAGGVAVCTAVNDQRPTSAVSDGDAGAIVAWEDYRGDGDIFAARVTASGATPWAADGVEVCTAPDSSLAPQLTSDGAGGAIVVWQDSRDPAIYQDDIYAQRISASGEPLWTTNGVALSTATFQQRRPVIAPDGSGGAIVTWGDLHGDIWARRVDASGTPHWTPDGVPVCDLISHARDPNIVADGSGGAIVTWYESRQYPPLLGYDVFARRVTASGTLLGPEGGVPITMSAVGDFFMDPVIAPDGGGGAIIAWKDERAVAHSDIFAQQFAAAAVSAPQVATTAGASLVVRPPYPNPFRSAATLWVGRSELAGAEIEVFNAAGRRVSRQSLGIAGRGWQRVSLVARDESGEPLASGVYLYRVRAGTETVSGKMTIAR